MVQKRRWPDAGDDGASDGNPNDRTEYTCKYGMSVCRKHRHPWPLLFFSGVTIKLLPTQTFQLLQWLLHVAVQLNLRLLLPQSLPSMSGVFKANQRRAIDEPEVVPTPPTCIRAGAPRRIPPSPNRSIPPQHARDTMSCALEMKFGSNNLFIIQTDWSGSYRR
jgi:hypothetical protein